MFAHCTQDNPCGNYGVWMRGDRVYLTTRLWTGIILSVAAPPIGMGQWLDGEHRFWVLYDGESSPRVTHPFNLVLLQEDNRGSC